MKLCPDVFEYVVAQETLAATGSKFAFPDTCIVLELRSKSSVTHPGKRHADGPDREEPLAIRKCVQLQSSDFGDMSPHYFDGTLCVFFDISTRH